MMNPHDSAASLNTWMVRDNEQGGRHASLFCARGQRRARGLVSLSPPPSPLSTIPIFSPFSRLLQKPEYALQAALAALLLLTGHWVPGLAHGALAVLHARAWRAGEAGVDVTEIFKQAPGEKRRRAWRLGLYLLTFIYIIYRLVEAAVHALLTPDGRAVAQELLHQAAATM